MIITRKLLNPSSNYNTSAESHKGINDVQRCSVENQKGAIAIVSLYRDSALLVLNGSSLQIVNALLVLN